MKESRVIKLPATFFNDYEERELPTPNVVRRSSRFVWIKLDDGALSDLLQDARWYASEDVDLDSDALWVRRAARTLLASFNKQTTEDAS